MLLLCVRPPSQYASHTLELCACACSLQEVAHLPCSTHGHTEVYEEASHLLTTLVARTNTHTLIKASIETHTQAYGMTLEDVPLYDMSADFVVMSEKAEVDKREKCRLMVCVYM